MNTMTIGGYQAVIAFDPDIQRFRGEFVGLNGGADFYAAAAQGQSLNQWATEAIKQAALAR